MAAIVARAGLARLTRAARCAQLADVTAGRPRRSSS
jgi:hypothetical protein